MERRFLLAVGLMIAVLVVPSFFLKRPPARRPGADTTRTTAVAPASPVTTRSVPTPSAAPMPAPVAAPMAAPSPASFDTAWLTEPAAAYRFSTLGATIDRASFPALKSFRVEDHKAPLQLIRDGDRLLAQRLVTGADTAAFDRVPFSVESRGDTLRMTGTSGDLTESVSFGEVRGHPYLIDVQGVITGLSGRGALLIVGLGEGFRNVEADSMDNYRAYGVAVRRTSPDNVNFRSVNPGVARTLEGPLDWVAVKSKYFIGALLGSDSSRPQLAGAILLGLPREGSTATRLQTWVTMPVGTDGRFHYQLYLGPNTHQTLGPLGRDLERASPYGGKILAPIVMPVAALITRLFIWMHEQLNLGYGLSLVIFGIMVRLILWPLNQKAMKSQVAMMAIQPVLKDLQTRHKNDPAKLQSEMMKTYKEHGVNPLGGCLPLLIPMPVLFALFFVFSRAIELRGTPFLWLPDLSLRDPLFITPLVMGLSMFALSKMSQAGMPPNPQAKTMTYTMPVVMTVLFLRFASGLNLYYAVSNLVSLPQQFLINKARRAEMTRRQVATTKT